MAPTTDGVRCLFLVTLAPIRYHQCATAAAAAYLAAGWNHGTPQSVTQ